MLGCSKRIAAVVLLSCTVVHARQTAPKLQLAVNRATVRAGERVRLSINPKALASQFSFAVGFQDGPIDVLPTGQTSIEHEYRTPGTYKISITSQEPIPEVSNNGIEVVVTGIPMTAQPRAVKAGEPVTFTIAFTPPQDTAARYRFLFGDGSSTGWRDSPSITYSYATPEVYITQGEVLSTGWTQAIATSTVEVAVEMAASANESSDSPVEAGDSLIPWALIPIALVALALVAFAGYKARQWLFPPKLSYELHRGGVGGNLDSGAPLDVVLEIILAPGIAAGRHDASKLEVKRARSPRKNG
jgi:PKD domain